MPLLATIDPWIFTFSAATVIATIWMGFWSARRSKTAHDFYVAGRTVSVGWNASAISGEYLSAASFMGVAGMVMSSGYDALWYPVGYACGYLFLLLFIAGPLRRFGAYTIPDFAEGRFDSPVFRKIAVIFVLFIGFFYTMPQMKGAGTTLAYIFPGLPYWAGVVLVGAVITLNVALGGMKGITLVQAFQYWAKMFAISVPIFVLMTVYGHYGNQLKANAPNSADTSVHLALGGVGFQISGNTNIVSVPEPVIDALNAALFDQVTRKPLPEKAPADSTWLSPFGPLTTKAAKSARPAITYNGALKSADLPLTTELHSPGLGESNSAHFFARDAALLLAGKDYPSLEEARGKSITLLWSESMETQSIPEPQFRFDTKWEYGEAFARHLQTNGVTLVRDSPTAFRAFPTKEAVITPVDTRPYALLYTYSLIIALVCGTAGLPHILVRFYTNPDGVAAKRTTMWVMILIGVFYLFPPVFGVMGRNLLPELYAGVGAKGTDKVVLELPRILNSRGGEDGKTGKRENGISASPFEGSSSRLPTLPSSAPTATGASRRIPWGSILSGITCAGAFAAFMSTFSGLLVSMTGALAHDVYGRMINPKANAYMRLRMFKVCAVLIGGVAILLGMQVEPLQINFMVGQAFAIAAASYFPLLFMSAWWRGMTMKGAATGMLTGGICALAAVTLTNFSDLGWFRLAGFWAAHPLLRILCEQPALWTVPLAIGLMIVVSKLTAHEVPSDIRMKMLVLHAPEKLGLKQEYIQEHQHGH